MQSSSLPMARFCCCGHGGDGCHEWHDRQSHHTVHRCIIYSENDGSNEEPRWMKRRRMVKNRSTIAVAASPLKIIGSGELLLQGTVVCPISPFGFGMEATDEMENERNGREDRREREDEEGSACLNNGTCRNE